MKKKSARPVQLTFDRLLDGLRKRGGRKKSPDSGVPHLKRPRVTERTPVFVTIKLKEGLPRSQEARRVRGDLERAHGCSRASGSEYDRGLPHRGLRDPRQP